MRILLDACVPRRLANELPGHEVRTVPEMGWADLDDGPLLEAMAGLFDALVTVDKNLPKQQRVRNRLFGIVVLRARTNRLADLLPLVAALRAALEELRPGEVRDWPANTRLERTGGEVTCPIRTCVAASRAAARR
jgi:predicted nuclease of predicted toxin-antitoxin system